MGVQQTVVGVILTLRLFYLGISRWLWMRNAWTRKNPGDYVDAWINLIAHCITLVFASIFLSFLFGWT